MKKLISIIIIAATLLAIVSCGEKAASYKTDVSVAALAEAADKVIASADTLNGITDSEYIKNNEIASSGYEEAIVKVAASGTALDEYGIFKASDDASAESLKNQLTDYLKLRADNWMDGCMPEEEHPKVDKATVKVMGRYVVYCILSDSEKEAVFTAIDNILLGK